jgi:hypothetical protein
MLVPPNVFADGPFAGFFEKLQAVIWAFGSSRLSTSSVDGAHLTIDLRLRRRSKAASG